ncbi:MAG: cytochrome C oxidase subunit IV family protein [Chloroflexi bacterium]|nr:cytochrome C oxidase subunit IV family protein [Chloroflexota bacterium]
MEDRAHSREHPHPGPAEYVRIAVVLAVITVVEVAIYYIEALSAVLVPILLVLSALKFALVALWFMHLKFDNRLFSAIFTVPLAVAAAVLIALLALFQRLFT